MNIPPTQFIVKNLDPNIDRKRFCSSDDDLNDYFYNDALRDLDYLYSITKVVIYDGEIVGFFTLVADTIHPDSVDDEIGEKYEYAKLPAIKIARLATAAKYQGQGIGKTMMIFIFRIVLDIIADVGCRVITVDAKKDAVGFYRRFAFNPVCSKRRTDTVPMYLDIKPLRDANM